MEAAGSTTTSKRKRDDNDEGRAKAKEKKVERRAAKRAAGQTSGTANEVVQGQLGPANGTGAREQMSETEKAQYRAEKKARRTEQRAASRQVKHETAGTISAATATNGESSMAQTAEDVETLSKQDLKHQVEQKPKRQRTTAAEMWTKPTEQAEKPAAHVDSVNSEDIVASKKDKKIRQKDFKEQRQKKKDEQKEKSEKNEKRDVQRELLAIPQDGTAKPAASIIQAIGISAQSTAPASGPSTEIVTKRKSTASRRKERNATEGKEVEYKSRKPEGRSAPWTISKTVGGRYIDADPCFTPDEQYLVLATEAALLVYTTQDSLLAHSYISQENGRISAYTVSASQPDLLWIATEKGRIIQWNFKEDTVLGVWGTDATIHHIHAVATGDEPSDILYTIDRGRGWLVTAHQIGIDGDLAKTELATLLNIETPLRSLSVLDQGRTIIVLGFDGFWVGIRTSQRDSPFTEQKYSWREIRTTEAPACCAVRATPGTTATRKSTVNVVIGGIRGCIYMYQDVTRNESPSASSQLHWHREEVGALAWSADGNYLISGGRETVLVLWQLETGSHQFLPHLESPIGRIVVSPTGTSYAIRLADNSVMVMSTSELTPTSNIAGLQSMAFPSLTAPKPKLDTVSSQRRQNSQGKDKVVAVINPRDVSQLLLVVPSSQAETEDTQYGAAPYLQMYDINNGRQSGRQALTRTNATDTNLAPGGERIREPDVKLVAVTPNGKWMATVEEWAPPLPDVQDITSKDDMVQELDRLYDTKLKLWTWHERDGVWMMNSRIDSPHSLADSSMRILDMVVDPSGSRFATIGADSVVKLWTPRHLTKSGRTIKGEAKESASNTADPSTWWSLDLIIPLENSYEEEPLQVTRPTRAKLAFSADGTVLAASEYFGTDSAGGLVHFIDPEQGLLTATRSGLYSGPDGIHQLGITGHHLICVGRSTALVWDLTNFDLKAEHRLQADNKTTEELSKQAVLAESTLKKRKTFQLRPAPQLAIDHASSTFAIAVAAEINDTPRSDSHPLLNYNTKLHIFSAKDDFSCMHRANLQRLTMAILPAGATTQGTDAIGGSESKGYVILNSVAEVRQVRPDAAGRAKNLPPVIDTQDDVKPDAAAPEEIVPILEMDMEMETDEDEPELAGSQTEDVSALLNKDEDDRVVVRPQELAQLFDYSSHAMPSMNDLFTNVRNMFSGRSAQPSNRMLVSTA